MGYQDKKNLLMISNFILIHTTFYIELNQFYMHEKAINGHISGEVQFLTVFLGNIQLIKMIRIELKRKQNKIRLYFKQIQNLLKLIVIYVQQIFKVFMFFCILSLESVFYQRNFPISNFPRLWNDIVILILIQMMTLKMRIMILLLKMI